MKKVLLVEDDPAVVDLIRLLLKEVALISSAGEAETGIRLYESEMPDMVFMDLTLPGMSGFVALKRIRALAQTSSHPVKIVVISSRNQPEDREMALKQGADDYISKPFEHKKLIDTFTRLTES